MIKFLCDGCFDLKEKIILCVFCQFNCYGYFFSYLRVVMYLYNLNIFVFLFLCENNLF